MNEQNSTADRDSPAGLDYLSEIIKNISSSASQSTSSQAAVTTEKTESPLPSSSPDLFSSLLSNPELLAKLPTILSAVKPIMELMSASSPASVQSKDTSVSASTSSVSNPERKVGTDRREALLCAMKPYLSRDRCQAIDYIIKLSHLGEILKTL